MIMGAFAGTSRCGESVRNERRGTAPELRELTLQNMDCLVGGGAGSVEGAGGGA
jgi:hypothetical protein